MAEQLKQGKVHDLIQDDRNLNKGTERGRELIEKSLRQFGAGRSILVDKNNRIIAGNKTHANAEAAGIDDAVIVETDGTKLVVVKRTDIDLDSKQGREMALADNATVKVDLEWDTEQLESVADDFGIDTEEWEIEDDDTGVFTPFFPQTRQNNQGENNTPFSAPELPQELVGVQLTPDELPKIEGNNETLMERVIIVYPKDREGEIARLLGLERIEKVVYNIKEINPKKEDTGKDE